MDTDVQSIFESSDTAACVALESINNEIAKINAHFLNLGACQPGDTLERQHKDSFDYALESEDDQLDDLWQLWGNLINARNELVNVRVKARG